MIPKCFKDVTNFEVVEHSSSYAKVKLDDNQTVILPLCDCLVYRFTNTFSDLQASCTDDGFYFNLETGKVVTDEPLDYYKDWVHNAKLVSVEDFCRQYILDVTTYASPIKHNEDTDMWYFDINGEKLTDCTYDTSKVAYKLGMFCDGTSLWVKEGF